MPRDKSRYRDRRSSSSSSESSYERKKKSKYRRRSRSRDRSESSSHRRKRSTSRSKRRRRSYTRSTSREKYEKPRRRSRSRRDRSKSRSHSKTKHSKSGKKSRRRSRSSSRSSPYEERPTYSKINLDDTEIKLEKAIKAAAAAGLTMTKIPTYEYKEVAIKEDMPTIHDRNLLEELNSDSFVQRTFTSSAKKKESKNIVIDLDNQTITMPEVEVVKQDDECIINVAEIPGEEDLIEMWIKKLYQFRKRMLKGDI